MNCTPCHAAALPIRDTATAPRQTNGVLRTLGSAIMWLAFAAFFIFSMGSTLARAESPNAPTAAQSTAITAFSTAHEGAPPAPWRFTGLPNKTPTRFDVVALDGQHVLKVQADASYGNLVHATFAPLAANPTLSWRWRVDELVRDADLRTRAGDDGAAKMCVFFDFPADRLSLGERTRLALARKVSGEDVPSETLCYVWDNKQAKGTALPNAFTNRIRMIVLESGQSATAGAWVAERRNLQADYRRAFADEAGDTMPDVVAVAVSADADNTNGHGLSFFSDIELRAGAGVSGMQDASTRALAKPSQGE